MEIAVIALISSARHRKMSSSFDCEHEDPEIASHFSDLHLFSV